MSSTVAAARGPLRPWNLARNTPLSVWLVVALLTAGGVLYSVLVPLLHAPDEPAHIDLLLNVDVEEHLDVDPYEGLQLHDRTLAALPRVELEQVDWRFLPEQPWTGLASGEVELRRDRPEYADLAGPGTDRWLNPARAHPPLYYTVVDGGDWLLPGSAESSAWDWGMLRLRLVSLLLWVPVPWLVFWTGVRVADRLTSEAERVGLAAAVGTLAVPQLLHGAGSVNNDALTVLLGSIVLLASAWIATGDESRRTVVIGSVAAGAACVSKVFGMAAPVWLAAAVLGGSLVRSTAVGTWHRLRPALPNLGLAVAVTTAAGAWWPVRMLVLTGSPVPRDFAYPVPDAVSAPFLPWIGEVVSRLSFTFWGRFGVEQFPLPDAPVVVATVVGLGLLAVGVTWAWRRRGETRVAALVLLLPAVTTLAMILYAAWQGYQRSGLPVGLHGRYLFVGIAGLAALGALGAARLLGGHTRWLPAATLLAAAAMQAIGAATVLRGYWAGTSLAGRVRSLTDFAPLSGRWLAVVLAAAVVAGLWLLVQLVRDGLRPEAA